jgi:anaerobic ribonucleoside-triphosphate reductase activating protein
MENGRFVTYTDKDKDIVRKGICEIATCHEGNHTMNYANIKTYSIENGTGVRVSLFVSGCTHHCKGCFNEEAWDFSYGKPFTKETEDEVIKSLQPDYMAGITLLGGEPMEPQNQRVLVGLLKRIRKELPEEEKKR